jgi:transposase
MAIYITPGNEQQRAHVQALAQAVRLVTGRTVKPAFSDQGDSGEEPAQATRDEGIELRAIKLRETKKGFVLLRRRWIVERSFAGSLGTPSHYAFARSCRTYPSKGITRYKGFPVEHKLNRGSLLIHTAMPRWCV